MIRRLKSRSQAPPPPSLPSQNRTPLRGKDFQLPHIAHKFVNTTHKSVQTKPRAKLPPRPPGKEPMGTPIPTRDAKAFASAVGLQEFKPMLSRSQKQILVNFQELMRAGRDS